MSSDKDCKAVILRLFSGYSGCQNNFPITFMMLRVEQQMTPGLSALSESLILSNPFFRNIFLSFAITRIFHDNLSELSEIDVRLSMIKRDGKRQFFNGNRYRRCRAWMKRTTGFVRDFQIRKKTARYRIGNAVTGCRFLTVSITGKLYAGS